MIIRLIRRYPNLAAFLFGTGCILIAAVMLEGVLQLRAWWRSEIPVIEEKKEQDRFFIEDAELGYRPRPLASEKRAQKWRNDRHYECICHIDEYGRRITPVSGDEERNSFALFFGGSFTFGEYVNDDETLPTCFGEAAPCFRPYNYAFSGYGPQQMLIHAERAALKDEVAEKKGIAVYLFIDNHVGRACGELRLIAKWGLNLPDLRYENGEWLNKGPFIKTEPVRIRVFNWLSRSHLFTWALNRFGVRQSEKDYDFTAAMIHEAAETLTSRFEEVRFFTVIYPGNDVRGGMQKRLENLGVTVLTIPDLFAPEEWEEMHFIDGHPSPLLYPRLAERLTEYIHCDEAAAVEERSAGNLMEKEL